MGEWILYTKLNYVHPKPTHLTPLLMNDTIYYLIIVIYYFWYFYVKNVILGLGDLFPFLGCI